MNKTINILSLFLFANVSHATLISTGITNISGVAGEESHIVLDNAGVQITSGFIGLGVFNIDNSAISSLSTAQDLSNSFFNISDTGASGDFLSDFAGAFQFTISGNTDDTFEGTSTFSGNNAYLVIGDGATLATSSQFLKSPLVPPRPALYQMASHHLEN